MTAHIVIPEWDTLPITTSKKAMQHIRETFGDWLIISDCLTMGAITERSVREFKTLSMQASILHYFQMARTRSEELLSKLPESHGLAVMIQIR